MAKQKETLAPYLILDVKPLTRDTKQFTFRIPADTVFTFLPGDHMKMYPDPDDYLEWRPYTPTTTPNIKDHFELIIKRYNDGMVSRFIHDRKPGDQAWMSGPHEGGHFIKGMAKEIGMVAGGTGITPLISIIRSILADHDDIKIGLIFANKTVDDIILKTEFDRYAEQFANFRRYYVVDNAPPDWDMGRGRIDTLIMKEHLPQPSDDAVVFVCGPPLMQIELLKKLVDMGFSREKIIFP